MTEEMEDVRDFADEYRDVQSMYDDGHITRAERENRITQLRKQEDAWRITHDADLFASELHAEAVVINDELSQLAEKMEELETEKQENLARLQRVQQLLARLE